MGRDYRIGLMLGSILAGFALLWVTTRPSLTPQPQPAPSSPESSNQTSAKVDNLALPPGTTPEPRPDRLVPNEPAHTASGGSLSPTARDANAPAKATRFHVVRPGETLSAIAELYYGSPNVWRKILDANKTLKDANKIAPGTKLVIPE